MISIVIPTLNEEKVILNLMNQLKNETFEHEIIIADAGSTDNTLNLVKPYGKILNCSRKGRGHQLNEGAKVAKGSIIWFLHADSKINKGVLNSINNTISSGYNGGCLSLYFYDSDKLFMKFVSTSSNLRAKYLKLIFGDQSFFIEKKLYNSSNGFKEIPIMEDWDFSKRIHKLGKIKVLKDKIGTSSRRFKSGGALRTLLKMHRIKLMYIMGVPPDELIKKYREIR